MNAKEIQTLVAKDFMLRGHPYACENVKYLFSDWEHDVITISKNEFVYEFEVKITRSDFTRDRRKKRKFESYNMFPKNSPNYFSYVFGEEVTPVPVKDIPDRFGIYQVISNVLIEVRKPKILHDYRHNIEPMKDKFLRLFAQRRFLGMAKLTYKNKQIIEGRSGEKDRNHKLPESNESISKGKTNDLFRQDDQTKKE